MPAGFPGYCYAGMVMPVRRAARFDPRLALFSRVALLALVLPCCDAQELRLLQERAAVTDAGPDSARSWDARAVPGAPDARQRTDGQCNGSEDCWRERPHCDEQTHQCVECTSPAHCDEPLTCDVTSRRCVARCASDADCRDPSSPHCDTDRQVCEGCRDDRDCDSRDRPFCHGDVGACVACLTDVHCPTVEPFCHAVTLRCVDCRVDSDCPDGEQCSWEGYCAPR